jgi:HEAT repeat protein
MAMTDHVEEALTIFSDPSRSEHEREKALQLLVGFPSNKVTAALITALHEPDSGVRWAASDALAMMGDAALNHCSWNWLHPAMI